jgi:prolyl oligopeptidase
VRNWGSIGILGAAIALAGGAWAVEDAPARYPQTRQVDQVDDYHGTRVADPYRWLETDVRESSDVADWVARQNKVTLAYLRAIPEREEVRARLEQLWNYEKYTAPFKKGGRYYFYKNDGLQNQSVLYTQQRLDAPAEVLLDPNAWSQDGTVALGGTAFSDDGKYVAYAVSEAGSDWRTWRVMEIATRAVLPDELRWSKSSGAAWTKDGRGFFYGRFQPPAEGKAFQALTYNMQVFYHTVGGSQADDTLVYERPDHPEWGFQIDVTEDGRYLVLTAWIGTDERYSVFLRDLESAEAKPEHFIGDFDAEYELVGNDGPVFYLKTNESAPNGRVIAVDLGAPGKAHWREVIAERPEALRAAGYVGEKFVASYLKDARSQVIVYSKAGKVLREIELPGIGSAGGFEGKSRDLETFYDYSSYATPPSIYRYEIETGKSTLLRQAKVDMDPAAYVTEQVFYASKDGTRVPMFVTRKKDAHLDGNNRCLLFGYGGFNIPSTPGFSVSRIAWLERGGVYAVANLRGGGEYGEAWHRAGTKLKKQNVFDDFIAAAEWLVAKKYTKPELLTIQGRSNGGLLVGAAMTQRPELFGCALPAVGVMDMLRFHKFTAGRFWVDDYGSSDNPEEFKALYAYSPYQSLKPGVGYPPTLVTTADTDDRVVPGHSFKFAARLQEVQAGKNPVLIRIDTRAGHGGGKPTSKLIEEYADEIAFALHHTRPE